MTKKTVRYARPRQPDSWERVDWLEHNFAKDPSPLLEALRSPEPLPEHLRIVLIDLLERYRLVLKKGAKHLPSYRRLSDAEAVLEAATEEYRARRLAGPLRRLEMEAAVEVLKDRAKSEGRGRREFDPKKSAQTLREERNNNLLKELAADYGVEIQKIKTHVQGKRGASRRRR